MKNKSITADVLFTVYMDGKYYKHWIREDYANQEKLSLWIPAQEQQANLHWEAGNQSGNEKCIDVTEQENISIQINDDNIRFWFGDNDKTVLLDSEEMEDTLCDLADFMDEMEEHYEECYA